jgi:L-alanine-DL-glutamate epimerase-like enolase superfamily enzyme
LGQARSEVPAYGSGGFTSYTVEELQKQLSGWAALGIHAVKMKIGTRPEDDVDRVKAARAAVGAGVRLMVDANGAYTRQQALQKALEFGEFDVRWFEEPVSSDDLEGLRYLRERGPAGMEIAAGEYGYDALYFRRMLEAGAVDVLQADATRCAGVTGFLQVDGLAEGFGTPLSAHTAPTLHTHLCCAAVRARDVEYFYDHARIERMFFDGAIEPVGGMLRTGGGPGLGLELKSSDVEKYKIYGNLYSSK